MKRRNFLKSAATAFPIALTQPFALALAPEEQPAKEAHIVPSGEDRFGEDRSLGFSRLRFKTSTQDSGGNLFVIEHSNLTGGPPLHLHYEQEEYFYVMEGVVLFQIGKKKVTLKAGDSVLAPRMVPHAFSTVGPSPAKLLIAFSPAGMMEQYFRDTAKSPVPAQDAAYFNKYGVKLIGPPIKVT